MRRCCTRKGAASFLFMSKIGRLLLLKLSFIGTADGAGPIFGKVIKRCAGCYTILGVAFCGVIYPTARNTSVLIHNLKVFIVCFLIVHLSLLQK